ncbi:conjugal transfer protein TraI [Pseudochryseolinea flava]|uniref:Conjugal transfer protein TraI n=1 Tax=Pseudochryseolinea flava TaxID=2059302 RepID=A0A364XXH7_9BACT|nr:conjugal transfer protein TraI [Pseudochryseolinea flava]
MRIQLIVIFSLVGLFTAWPVAEAAAAGWIQEIIKKILKALDLMVQRLQNKTIALQNTQKALENALSKLKLREIAEWTEKHRKLYADYYNELWKVKNLLSTIEQTRAIVKRQERLVNEYKKTWNIIKSDSHFSGWEIDYMYRVYTRILERSLTNLEQLSMVINSFQTQMTDESRMAIIAQASDQSIKNLNDLRQFNEHNMLLSISRAKDKHEIESTRKLYDLTND